MDTSLRAAAQVETVVAMVRARPEFIEEVKAACLALVEPSRADPGCLSYELYQSSEEPALFVFIEQWQSRQAIENHLAQPHALAFDEKIAGLLAEEESIIYLNRIA
jgi:quinol monooxygenase YgiN